MAMVDHKTDTLSLGGAFIGAGLGAGGGAAAGGVGACQVASLALRPEYKQAAQSLQLATP